MRRDDEGVARTVQFGEQTSAVAPPGLRKIPGGFVGEQQRQLADAAAQDLTMSR
ncbi:hypothetical protein [Deinococcus sonorensis]|uniref:Uncharacterized protein n=2 Tax=Deinococcus sonorensis TaxID=309891 RepID=A0AAU7U749_9DEIO